MAETIPGVNVQALTAFFSKYIEPPKPNTQPRRKIQKNKAFSKLLEFSSKPDLTTCKNSNSSSFSRSLSVFDLPNAGILPNIAKSHELTSKRKRTSITSVPTVSSVPNHGVCTSAKLYQDNSSALDTASSDSGVDEFSECSTSGDSRHSEKHSSNSVRNPGALNCNIPLQNSLSSESNSEANSQKSPTVNIIVKNPFLENNRCVQSEVINSNRRNVVTTVWNRTYEVDINTEIEKNLLNKPSPEKLFYSEIVVSDNYVCKAQYKRTELPSSELLGPPPCKPKKLDNVTLSSLFPTLKCHSLQRQDVASRVRRKPVREACSSPPQLLNELRLESMFPETSFAQDNYCSKHRMRTVSDLTANSSSYHHQKHLCESTESLCSDRNQSILPQRPPILPPRRVSYPLYLPEKSDLSPPDTPGEELYQDAAVDDDNVYEEVPLPSDFQSNFYVNHGNPNKMSREIARLWQKEQRERVRQEKELEKLKKKFGLTGEEVPLDKGYVKNDAKGGRGDLAVKKGEEILILRIEDNPIGRLLVQNEKGKIGYVSLDNLTVDADSIKIVMRERKHSMGSKEGKGSSSSSNGEAIYEEC